MNFRRFLELFLSIWVGFEDEPRSMALELVSAAAVQTKKPYLARPEEDNYWKIGLALPDVELGRERLTEKKVEVIKINQLPFKKSLWLY